MKQKELTRTMQVKFTVEELVPRRMTVTIDNEDFLYADYNWVMKEFEKWLLADRKENGQGVQFEDGDVEVNTTILEPTGMSTSDIQKARKKSELAKECRRLGVTAKKLSDMKSELCRRAVR